MAWVKKWTEFATEWTIFLFVVQNKIRWFKTAIPQFKRGIRQLST